MEVKSEVTTSGAGGQFELLDLLAEVASQELQNEGRGTVPASSSKIPPKPKTGNARNKRKSLVDYDSFDVGQIKRMSQASLLKLFAEQDAADEMRKTFAFRCRMLPEACAFRSQSFGSEAKAKADMKRHLIEHVAAMCASPAEGIRVESVVARKRKRLMHATVPSASVVKTEKVSGTPPPQVEPPPPAHAPILVKQEPAAYSKPSVIVEPVNPEEAIMMAPVVIAPEESEIRMPDTLGHDHCYFGVPGVLPSFLPAGEGLKSEDDESGMLAEESYDEWIQGSLQPDEGVAEQEVAAEPLRISGYVQSEAAVGGGTLPLIGAEVDLETSSSAKVVVSKVSKAPKGSSLPAPIRASVRRDALVDDEAEERRLALEAIKALQASGSSGDEFWCRVCWPNKKFTAYTTLLSHLRSHAGFRPYECHICNAFFTRQHSLNYHLLIHTNETRFTCTDCGRKFRHPSHFKEHRRRHTGESPYECTECQIRYKTRNTYKRHMKIYHGKVVGPGGNLLSVPKSEVVGDELTVKPPPQQRVIRQRKQDIQPKVELSVAGAASPVPAINSSASGSDKENLEFLHDSDSLQADNDEVAAISREMETREAVLNGKAIIEVKADSSASSYPSTDSEFSSPEPSQPPPIIGLIPKELKSEESALPNFDASPPLALKTPKSIKKEAPESRENARKISGKEKTPDLLLQKRGSKSAFYPIQEPKRMKLAAMDQKPAINLSGNVVIRNSGLQLQATPQQAFLANINGKQVLLIPKKTDTPGSKSKLEERLRFGAQSQQKLTAGIRLVQNQLPISTTVMGGANQKCSVNVIASEKPLVGNAIPAQTVMSQHQ